MNRTAAWRSVLAGFGLLVACARADEPSLCVSMCDADARSCFKDAQYQPGSLGGIVTLALGAGLAFATNRNPIDPWKQPGFALQQGPGNGGDDSDHQAREELMRDCQATRRQCADQCVRQDTGDASGEPAAQTPPP